MNLCHLLKTKRRSNEADNTGFKPDEPVFFLVPFRLALVMVHSNLCALKAVRVFAELFTRKKKTVNFVWS